MSRLVSLLLASLALSACTESPRSVHAETVGARAASAASGRVTDSALGAALDRFRASLRRVDTLDFAQPSRDALVRSFLASLAAGDTLALARLHVSRAEWAWLVYPQSRLTRAPYRQRSDVAWMLLIEPSNVGLGRLIARRGDRPMALVRWTCADTATVDGSTRQWAGCRVTWRSSAGEERTEALFGSILEHAGRYKIGSYANQF